LERRADRCECRSRSKSLDRSLASEATFPCRKLTRNSIAAEVTTSARVHHTYFHRYATCDLFDTLFWMGTQNYIVVGCAFLIMAEIRRLRLSGQNNKPREIRIRRFVFQFSFAEEFTVVLCVVGWIALIVGILSTHL
jgi:hypothetical protein